MTLANRFPPAVKEFWIGHYTCLWCGKNTADALHHCQSPSSQHYQKGDFNKSILNSVPICNHGCHLYNGKLHQPEEERRLLRRVLEILVMKGYEFQPTDFKFYDIYKGLYTKDNAKRQGINPPSQ